MPELLREQILRGKRNFVVTGTHARPRPPPLLAWILESAGRNPNFVIGGIPENLGQGARFTGGDLTVLEGDEYDSGLLRQALEVHPLPARTRHREQPRVRPRRHLREPRRGQEDLRTPRPPRSPRTGWSCSMATMRTPSRSSRNRTFPDETGRLGPDCEARITDIDYRADAPPSPSKASATDRDERGIQRPQTRPWPSPRRVSPASIPRSSATAVAAFRSVKRRQKCAA